MKNCEKCISREERSLPWKAGRRAGAPKSAKNAKNAKKAVFYNEKMRKIGFGAAKNCEKLHVSVCHGHRPTPKGGAALMPSGREVPAQEGRAPGGCPEKCEKCEKKLCFTMKKCEKLVSRLRKIAKNCIFVICLGHIAPE